MSDNGVILVSGGKYRSFTDKLVAVNDVLSRMGDTTVAEVAAKGRRASYPIMRRKFRRMGLPYWKTWKEKLDDGSFEYRGSYWDSELGGFASTTRKYNGRGLRETSFSFEKKKNQRYRKRFFKSISEASVASLTANLWEYDHVMGNGSERYMWSYDSGEHWSYWKTGERRRGRHFFMTDVKSVIAREVPAALDAVSFRYKEELEKL